MTTEGRTLDVSELPTVGFGHRGLLWWGTLGFMVTEGTTLAVAAWAYFYVRKNFDSWPPAPLQRPDLGVATLGLLLLLVCIPVMQTAAKKAKALDFEGARRWVVIAGLLSGVITGLRLMEFHAVHVRWDENAYGACIWLLLGLHASLVATDIFESFGLAVLLTARHQIKHLSDVEDAALYQWFLSLVWVPIYVFVYLWPWWSSR
jgi:heme/copper-type cytochrome/quinol oxidase subunit 3